MHKILKSILFFLLFFSFASCSDEGPEGPTPHAPLAHAEKTLFVFMPYTPNQAGNYSLYSDLLENIGDMEKAIRNDRGTGDSHLVIFISKDYTTGNLISLDYKKGKCVRDTLKTYDTSFYASAEGMATLLNDMKHYAPANKYSMVVGCHGEGWMPKSSITRYFGGEKSPIDISDLANGIKAANIKMQFILFDACYMSAVEVAYELRETTDWYIASTSEVMGKGMPYSKLLGNLLKTETDYASLTHDFIEFYKNEPMPYATLGATDCSYMEEMAELMYRINSNHSFNPEDEPLLQDLDAAHSTPTIYYDFGSYVRRLCANDEATLAQFNALLEKLVPYKGHTTSIYSAAGSKSLRVKEFSGLTVSDPSENKKVKELKTETDWWIATH